jgi:hypothetical protein
MALPAKLASLGQSLVSGSTEEISALSGKNQQPLVPTTPVDGMVIGANQNQAKMLGGEPNIRNAIKIATQGTEGDASLADVERRGRTSSKAEDEALANNEALAQATSLQGRVQAAVDKMMQASITGNPEVDKALDKTVDVQALTAATQTNTPEERAEITTLLNRWNTTSDAQDKVRILARLDVLVKDDGAIPALFGIDAKAFASTVATAVPDTLKIVDVVALDPETTNSKMMVSIGLRPDNVDDVAKFNKMSWGEYKDAVATQSAQRYSNVEALRAVANDPTAPVQAQQQARQRLSELGAAGAFQAAETARTLSSRLQQHETVTLAGHTYLLEELLDNDKISEVIMGSLDNPDGLAGTAFAGLIPIIKEHKAELAKVSGDVATAEKGVKAAQTAATEAATVGNVTLPPAVTDVLNPQPAGVETGAVAYDVSKETPAYKAIKEFTSKSNDPTLNAVIGGVIADLGAPILSFVQNKDYSWLEAQGLFRDPPGFKAKAQNAYNLWKEIGDDTGIDENEMQEYLKSIFGNEYAAIQAYDKQDLAGLLPKDLDTNADGAVSTAEMEAYLKSTAGKGTDADKFENFMLPSKIDSKSILSSAATRKDANTKADIALQAEKTLVSSFNPQGSIDKIATLTTANLPTFGANTSANEKGNKERLDQGVKQHDATVAAVGVEKNRILSKMSELQKAMLAETNPTRRQAYKDLIEQQYAPYVQTLDLALEAFEKRYKIWFDQKWYAESAADKAAKAYVPGKPGTEAAAIDSVTEEARVRRESIAAGEKVIAGALPRYTNSATSQADINAWVAAYRAWAAKTGPKPPAPTPPVIVPKMAIPKPAPVPKKTTPAGGKRGSNL